MNKEIIWIGSIQFPKKILFLFVLIIIPIIQYGSELFNNILMGAGDILLTHSISAFMRSTVHSGELPFWNPYMLLGGPGLADPSMQVFYPFKWLAYLMPITTFSNVYFLLHLIMAGVFMFLFVRKLINNDLIALICGLILQSSTFISGYRKEHVLVYTAIVWVPIVLYLILCYFEKQKLKYLLFIAIAVALQFFGGHPQWFLYSGFLYAAFFIYLAIQNKTHLKIIILSALFVSVFVILLTAIQAIPTISLILKSEQDSFVSFNKLSSHPIMLFISVFPTAFGTPYAPFGYNMSTGIDTELYLGIIVLIYVLYVARYHWKKKFVRFCLIVAMATFAFSSIGNIGSLGEVVVNIPILNLFPFPSRIIFITIFSALFILPYAFIDFFDKNNVKRLVQHSFQMLILFSALAATFVSVSFMPLVRESLEYMTTDFFEIFGIGLLLAGGNLLCVLILFYLRKHSGKTYKYAACVILIFLCVFTMFDTFRFSSVYVDAGQNGFEVITSAKEIQFLKSRIGTDVVRMGTANTMWEYTHNPNTGLNINLSMASGIRNINGFNEFEDEFLRSFLGKTESRCDNFMQSLISFRPDVLSMLGIRYIVTPASRPLAVHGKNIIDELRIIEYYGEGEIIQSFPQDGFSLFSTDVSVKNHTNYRVSITLDIKNIEELDFLYVDFMSSDAVHILSPLQIIPIRNGLHSYTVILQINDFPYITNERPIMRIVAVGNEPVMLHNLSIYELVIEYVPSIINELYRTDNAIIYENLNAQQLLFIPQRIQQISNSCNITSQNIAFRAEFPYMDKIAYVENLPDQIITGTVSQINARANRVSAKVYSSNGTFVVHSQRMMNNWRAYVSGERVEIHRTNGVIQGAWIPPGKHYVEFVYVPVLFFIGAGITSIGIILAVFYLLNERYKWLSVFAFKKEQSI